MKRADSKVYHSFYAVWWRSAVEDAETVRMLLPNYIVLGGLVVSALATEPKVRGFNGFLRVIKIRSTTSFGGEVKPSVPCRRFTACKRTLRA
jgi:hypothetical protein